MDKITSIQIHDSVKKMLDGIGRHGETYEEIILRLLGKEC